MANSYPAPGNGEPKPPESELSKLSFAELEKAYQEAKKLTAETSNKAGDNVISINRAKLKKVYRETEKLAAETFTETENGVISANGEEGVFIRAAEGGFELSQITPGLSDLQAYIGINPNTPLTKVCRTKEEMIEAIRDILGILRRRVIE
jgi:hypothetical protein